jgi:lactoylglutathione lyase
MSLGAFSISLSVQNIQASKAFYENLGISILGGDIQQNWFIMKNGQCVIGLFHGMFDNNILTFNPGWDQEAQNIESFTDVRKIQQNLKSKGILFSSEVDEATEGPGSFVIKDPDGNVILFDQNR